MTPTVELPCRGSGKCQRDECAFYYETVLSDRREGEEGGAKWGARFLSTRICAYFCGCFQHRPSVGAIISVSCRNIAQRNAFEHRPPPPPLLLAVVLMDELLWSLCRPRTPHPAARPAPPWGTSSMLNVAVVPLCGD